MKSFLRRAAILLAATTTCATLLPVTTANAVGTWSPCDNETSVSGPTTIDLGDLGKVHIQLGTEQDVYVQYDSPVGTIGDTLVGADLQTINLGQNTAVCVTFSGIGVMVSVNVVSLEVDICTFSGQPYTAGPCLVGSW